MREYRDVVVELGYKVKGGDFEYFTHLPIDGEITCLSRPDMIASLPDAVLGIRVIGENYTFRRLRNVEGVSSFPDDPAFGLNFTKLVFRIRATLVEDDGTELSCASFVEVKSSQCGIQQNAPLPQGNWLYLVTMDGNNFKLLQNADLGGGAGDPCEELGCDTATDPLLVLRCWALGCYNRN